MHQNTQVGTKISRIGDINAKIRWGGGRLIVKHMVNYSRAIMPYRFEMGVIWTSIGCLTAAIQPSYGRPTGVIRAPYGRPMGCT